MKENKLPYDHHNQPIKQTLSKIASLIVSHRKGKEMYHKASSTKESILLIL